MAIAFIPNHLVFNKTKEFPYTSDEIEAISAYFSDDINLEYLRTKGEIKITNCHAGQKTIAISPSGKVYACSTGFAFMGDEQREKYFIGDLRQQTLDEIAEIAGNEHASFRRAVKDCDGCWGNCEVGHEIQFWGLHIGASTLEKKETEGTNAKTNEALKDKLSFEDNLIKVQSRVEGPGTELDLVKFEHSLQSANAEYEIPYYWSFGPKGIKTFLKRFIRKLLKCLIPPILEKQNRLNAYIINCLNPVKTLIIHSNAQTAEISLLKRELSHCRKEIEKQAKMLQDMMRLIEKDQSW